VIRNAVPVDPRPPVASGLRIGGPGLRGFDADDFHEVADIVAEALLGFDARPRRRPAPGSRH
jgi:glycine hydroxymethyltransferase